MTSFDFDQTMGVVPVFPLPDMALLPGELMPLYVFEPRYQRMLADALAGDRLIAMAGFEPGWEDSYYGNPDVKKIMGLGNIVAHRPRAGGGAEIVLKGVARVGLIEVVREMPYRLARVDPLPESVSDPDKLKNLTAEVFRLLEALCGQLDHPFGGADGAASSALDELPGLLVPLLQYDAETKQALLACDDIVCRLEVVLKALQARWQLVRSERGSRGVRTCQDPTRN